MQERPSECPVCGGRVIFGKMKDFGLKPRDNQSGYCYICEDCGRHIVTHKERHKDAMGTIAGGETKRLRRLCHEKMDALWETSIQRKVLYHRMAKELGIREDDCHFGYMDKEMLERALSILENWSNK